MSDCADVSDACCVSASWNHCSSIGRSSHAFLLSWRFSKRQFVVLTKHAAVSSRQRVTCVSNNTGLRSPLLLDVSTSVNSSSIAHQEEGPDYSKGRREGRGGKHWKFGLLLLLLWQCTAVVCPIRYWAKLVCVKPRRILRALRLAAKLSSSCSSSLRWCRLLSIVWGWGVVAMATAGAQLCGGVGLKALLVQNSHPWIARLRQPNSTQHTIKRPCRRNRL